MAQFLQQNWIGIIFIVAMMAMHLGGHRHGGHGGHGGAMHGGCGASREDNGSQSPNNAQDHDARPYPSSATPWDAPSRPSRDASQPDPTWDATRPDPTWDATRPDPTRDATRPDPTRDATVPDDLRERRDEWPEPS